MPRARRSSSSHKGWGLPGPVKKVLPCSAALLLVLAFACWQQPKATGLRPPRGAGEVRSPSGNGVVAGAALDLQELPGEVVAPAAGAPEQPGPPAELPPEPAAELPLEPAEELPVEPAAGPPGTPEEAEPGIPTEPAAGSPGEPAPETGLLQAPRKMEFYMYRATSAATYPLENVNAADLPGVMWYLHNEVVSATPRKYAIDRIRRYRVIVQNTQEFFNAHQRQFSEFLAFDAGRCATPNCEKIFRHYGFVVGCQTLSTERANYWAVNRTASGDQCTPHCHLPVWYSLPGPCPTEGRDAGGIDAEMVGLDVVTGKSAACLQQNPGGHCGQVTGGPDCTYSVEEAGEIFLDELVGIPAYETWWKGTGNQEYIPGLDGGIGTSFWNAVHDKEMCAGRMRRVQQLFKQHYPDLPEDLEQPLCDFDAFSDDEFEQPVNHTGAVPSGYWMHLQ